MGTLHFSLGNSCSAETDLMLKLLDNSEMEMKLWNVNPFFQEIFELEYMKGVHIFVILEAIWWLLYIALKTYTSDYILFLLL